MTHRLTTNYAKNYCNRTLIVKVIVENVVTCFLGHCSWWEACGPRGVGSSLKLGEQVEAPEMGLGTRKFLYKWLVPVHF